MRNAELQSLCDAWRQRIRYLRSWKITARFTKRGEISTYGAIEYDRDQQTAKIRVMRPAEMREKFGDSPVEHTLLHEMGHILEPDVTDENSDGIEASINRWSEALMEAHAEER
jgi:predicted HD phosphohydrolase